MLEGYPFDQLPLATTANCVAPVWSHESRIVVVWLGAWVSNTPGGVGG